MHTTPTPESSAAILELRPCSEFSSQGDLLRYVERTRRQLDRFEQLPRHGQGTIDPDDAALICRMCDELEADILMGLSAD